MIQGDLSKKKRLIAWRTEKLTELADLMNWYRESGEPAFLERAKYVGWWANFLKKKIDEIK